MLDFLEDNWQTSDGGSFPKSRFLVVLVLTLLQHHASNNRA